MNEKSRLTLDMTKDEHMYLKMASTKLGISMKQFLLTAAFERMEELEDEWLAEKARETLEGIRAGKERLASWKEVKKRLSK